MTEKITPVEEKIIAYLSLNRNKHTQEIEAAINIAYITVHAALARMTKKGYVTYVKKESEKKVLIKFYSLSLSGVIIAFAKNPPDTLIKTLDNYKADSKDFFTLKQLVNYMSQPTAIKFLRYAGDMAFGPKGISIAYALAKLVTLNSMLGLGDFTENEKREIAVAGQKVESVKVQLYEMWSMYKKVLADTEDFLKGGENFG